MKQYKLINNITGWVIFIFALIVYTLTIESSASFWDCGEFVPGAFKLEVVHPPGAPLFLMIGRIFTLFAGNDLTKVPVMVNLMSGLASAFAILFLFWSITALVRKAILKKEEDYNLFNIVTVMGCGVIGAACGTFCDSFWFSAVEAEVYALSIGFLMFVIWAIFKWDASEEKYADKWLILIAYAVGLSLGVHLLSLLALPILGITFYFKYYRFKIWTFLVAVAISFASVPLIMKFIISGMPDIAAKFDYLFVNVMGMSFNTGAIFGMFFVAFVLLAAIFITWKKNMPRWNTLALAITFCILGYSSYVMVPIRSVANPPINMNKPQDPYRLLSYLNREQYGDRPLIYGPQYTADQYDISNVKEIGEVIYKGKDKYEVVDKKLDYVWRDGVEVLFPRMGFWQEPEKVEAYRGWMHPEFNVVDRANNTIVDHVSNQEQATARVNALNAQQGNGQPRFVAKDDISMVDNIKFFLNYQLGFMYFRYLMWNFSGRQNDLQGFYFNDDGRWSTGFDGLDHFLSSWFSTPSQDQTGIPKEKVTNWGHNSFYMIPFLLGLLGAFYSYKKDPHVFTLIFMFWMITGVLQIVYLNQPPREPRERDYIFAGSVLAYSMWIGMAVLAITEFLKKYMKANIAGPVIAVLLCAVAPFLMGSQGWDDHSRHGRFIARDMAIDYLESCAPNAILFTQGDNDTYPLWYAQEVEGIRTDIRIVNLSLLGVDWYVDQLKYKMNDGAPVKLSFTYDQIKSRNRDVVRYKEMPGIDHSQAYNLKDVMKFVASERPEDKVPAPGQSGELENYLPSLKVFIPVDSMEMVRRNVVAPEDYGKMVKRLEFDIPSTTLMKNDLITLDIFANNLWERPIYFAVSVAPSAYMGVGKYAQMEGMAYRIVPILNETGDINRAPMRVDSMYYRLTQKFKWGNMADPKVYLDENVLRMTFNMRANYARLANELAARGDNKRALALMDVCMKGLPTDRVPLSIYNMSFPEVYYRCGKKDEGRKYANQLASTATEYLTYYQKVGGMNWNDEEIQRNMYMIQQMGMIMQTYGDSTEANKLQTTLQNFSAAFGRPMQPGAPQ